MITKRCWRIQQKRSSFVAIALKTNVYLIAKFVIPEEEIVVTATVKMDIQLNILGEN
jgi:hypothetical protein